MEHHGTPWKTSQQALVGSNYTSPSDLPALAASVSSSSHTTPELLSSSASSCSSSSESGLVLTPLSSPDLLSTTFGNPTRPVPMSRKLSCDLFECIEQYSRFSETTARYVFAQIVEVVWALGQMGICHRDIKDENIVIDSSFKVDRHFVSFSSILTTALTNLLLPHHLEQVKLIDFGAAVIFDPQQPAPFYNRRLLRSQPCFPSILDANPSSLLHQVSMARPPLHQPRFCAASRTKLQRRKFGRLAFFFPSSSLVNVPSSTQQQQRSESSRDRK